MSQPPDPMRARSLLLALLGLSLLTGSAGSGDLRGRRADADASALRKVELEGIEAVRETMHEGMEFGTEIHQHRPGEYRRTPVRAGDRHETGFEVVDTLVTLIHSHTSDDGYGHERSSWDWNVATNTPANVIIVSPSAPPTRIDTRGNVSELREGRFVPRR